MDPFYKTYLMLFELFSCSFPLKYIKIKYEKAEIAHVMCFTDYVCTYSAFLKLQPEIHAMLMLPASTGKSII